MMADQRDTEQRGRRKEKKNSFVLSLHTTRMPRRRFSFHSLCCQCPRRRTRTRRHSEPGRPWRAAAGRSPARAGATRARRSRARPRAGTRTGRSTRPCTPPPLAPPLASRLPPPPPAGGSPGPRPPLLALCCGRCFPRLRPSRRVSAAAAAVAGVRA
jgi:hypothetical protein